jgi:hypothetical protein
MAGWATARGIESTSNYSRSGPAAQPERRDQRAGGVFNYLEGRRPYAVLEPDDWFGYRPPEITVDIAGNDIGWPIRIKATGFGRGLR